MLKFLQEHESRDFAFGASFIASKLGLSEGSARTALYKLMQQGLVLRIFVKNLSKSSGSWKNCTISGYMIRNDKYERKIKKVFGRKK